ncbi:hypothetical protein [Frigoribacterium sp. NPDC087798]|uniref:hypothetical protein n=1 Tax=Frigoribacterium sp. NPDC087798 TaxID=3363993 RepID=UPI003810A589
MPLDEGKRASVVAMVRQEVGRNEIARAVGVSPTTVTRIAKDERLSFDRSKTAQATQVVSIDAKARRKALGSRLLSDMEEARLRLAQEEQARGFAAVAQGLDALSRSYANLAKLDGPDTSEMNEMKSAMGAFMELAKAVAETQENPFEKSGADAARRDLTDS